MYFCIIIIFYEYGKMLLCSQMCIPGLHKMREGAFQKICCMCWSQDLTSWPVLTKRHSSLILSIYFSFRSTKATNVFLGAILILYVRWQWLALKLWSSIKGPLLWIYWWDCCWLSETFLSHWETRSLLTSNSLDVALLSFVARKAAAWVNNH